MPKRSDIDSVLLLGAGPIVIGQACEFDYSGTQASRALREEGVRTVLLNSNPATIMTDPDMADAVYIEPVDAESALSIINKEAVDAVLPTMGGQTALNCAMELHRRGVFGEGRAIDGKPTLIGANAGSIHKAEDRHAFRAAMEKIGLQMAASEVVSDLSQAKAALTKIGFPVILRPSFTLGGSGGGIARDEKEFTALMTQALAESPTGTVLMERSLIGWKEFEMEVVRDRRDNCVIVCSIENLDPMGVHTGDSITVAPAQTLTDKEYQRMREASIAVIREIGVDCGGSNVQFAVNPDNGDMIVIEMNPRVSRSSALASKATGFPIAKISTRLALGYTLDEIRNDITDGRTPASFEPSIDYIVTKIPRFDFAKFAPTPDRLTTQMRSVGEVMAIGGDFAESMQKALCGLEARMDGFVSALSDDEVRDLFRLARPDNPLPDHLAAHRRRLAASLPVPSSRRILDVADAFRLFMTVDEVCRLTRIDRWFLHQIERLCQMEHEIFSAATEGEASLTEARVRGWKTAGFSDAHIGWCLDIASPPTDEKSDGHHRLLEFRTAHKIFPVYKRIDTCAAEFPTDTAYLYSTYASECELAPTQNRKIIILGSGPNRIGQGIEFDYCCVHAILALKEAGFETIMVNCNPETVSTDYDVADRLFFEPLTVECVWDIVRREKPHGVILQYGGQTPLTIARALHRLGAPVIGTPVDAIDLAESRERFQKLLTAHNLQQPQNDIVRGVADTFALTEEKVSSSQARRAILDTAAKVGYPLVVRPSYVLGGSDMRIVHSEEQLDLYLQARLSSFVGDVLLDKFVTDAVEVDVDAVRDHQGNCLIAGVMEHIERAGIHSGDSACSLPPYSLPPDTLAELKAQTRALAESLGVVGLMNVQFAVSAKIFVLEVNPRASRTVPFVSKATGTPVAKIAALAMAGVSLPEQGYAGDLPDPRHFSVKEAVFPFNKFPDVDVLLGPEMKSTGESMGMGEDFGTAFHLAQGAILPLPTAGVAVFSVRDGDKPAALDCARALADLGFAIAATDGTRRHFAEHGIEVERINKVSEGSPHIVDIISEQRAQLVVNTEGDSDDSRRDSLSIRRAALMAKVVYFTTLAGARAALRGMERSARRGGRPPPRSLREWYRQQTEAMQR